MEVPFENLMAGITTCTCTMICLVRTVCQDIQAMQTSEMLSNHLYKCTEHQTIKKSLLHNKSHQTDSRRIEMLKQHCARMLCCCKPQSQEPSLLCFALLCGSFYSSPSMQSIIIWSLLRRTTPKFGHAFSLHTVQVSSIHFSFNFRLHLHSYTQEDEFTIPSFKRSTSLSLGRLNRKDPKKLSSRSPKVPQSPKSPKTLKCLKSPKSVKRREAKRLAEQAQAQEVADLKASSSLCLSIVGRTQKTVEHLRSRLDTSESNATALSNKVATQMPNILAFDALKAVVEDSVVKIHKLDDDLTGLETVMGEVVFKNPGTGMVHEAEMVEVRNTRESIQITLKGMDRDDS